MNLKKTFRVTRNIFAGLFVAIMLAASYAYSNNYFEVSKNLDIFATMFKELNTYYVDDVDPNDLMREGIDAMLGSLDPYTNFYSEAEIENYRFQTTGKYGGIGAGIGKIDDQITITNIHENYAADKAGLLIGDRILEVEGKSTDGKNTEDVSKILKGQPGTEVEILISRMNSSGTYEDMTIAFEREEVKVKNVPYYGVVSDKVGYIKLANFTQNAGKEVKNALKDLIDKDGIESVVLDLRGNPGGLLPEAVNVTNVFVPKGSDVVSTKGKITESNKTFRTLNDAVDTEIPVIVIIDRNSASASEIVSGAIQDLDRGVVLGEKSFGKGLVQSTRTLTYNTKLKLTTAKYYIPSGRCIQAINYDETDENGEIKRIPDSLKTAFYTSNGRVVYDGGGIDPDFEVDRDKLAPITRSLLRKNHIFNFATNYMAKNSQLPEVQAFVLTNEDFEDFTKYVSGKDYDYETASEKLLDDLTKAAKEEKYYNAIQEELELLSTQISHDKNRDLEKAKDEILQILEEEIINRVYHADGRILKSFEDDKQVLQAIELFEKSSEYQALLVPEK